MRRTITLLALLGWFTAGCSKSSSGPTTPVPPPPTGPGQLYVTSSPAGVPITKDGVATGFVTPKLLSFEAGTHSVGLKFLGYADSALSRTIVSEAKETLSVALRPLPGTPRTVTAWASLPGYLKGLACGPGGTVYATTDNARTLTIYSSAGTQLGSVLLATGRAPGRVTVATAGSAYHWHGMGNLDEGRVEKYSGTPSYLQDLLFSTVDATWPKPSVPAIGAGDSLFVAMNLGGSMSYAGTSIRSFVGDLDTGSSLVVAPALIELVAAGAVHRLVGTGGFGDTVWVLTPNGAIERLWKAGLESITALAATPLGEVYVAGPKLGITVIRRFGPTGLLVGEWEVGAWASSDHFVGALAVDAQGVLFAGTWHDKRVLRYGL